MCDELCVCVCVVISVKANGYMPYVKKKCVTLYACARALAPCRHGCQVVCRWVGPVTLRCKRAGRGRDGEMAGGNRRTEGVIECSCSVFLWSNIRRSC